MTRREKVGIFDGMRYTPRQVFKEFHSSNWHRACIVAARRTGKTYAAVAELLKRSYNGPQDGQYLFISPLAEQSMANTIGMFQRFDDEGYIIRFDKTNGVLTLANGAQITLGGARAAEKYRGRYLDGCIVDEISQVPPETISEVILPCLSDRNGWLAYLGTARADDGFRLYKIYKEYEKDPKWFTRMISVYQNTEGFTPERIQEIHDETLRFCLTNGMTKSQAEQTFNVEFACDFSFIDEGKPMTTALFYQELQNLFDSKPSRMLDPTEKDVVCLPSTSKIAVFDISHSAGRDYTVTTIVAETPTTPIVTNILWERDKPWQFWFDYLHQQGIRTVALPFDSSVVNKETMLSLNQTFKRNGFNVIRIKRLLREEQVESGRWLLNNCRFTKDCVPGLSEIGRFQQFNTKHGLEQDVVASLLYAGQVLQKKHTKLEIAERIRKNYSDNSTAYNYGVNIYNGIIGE